MAWLFFPLLIIAVLLGYLLFAPIYLEINSLNGLCGARLHHLASANLVLVDSSFKINLSIIGWKKQIDLLSKRKTRKKASRKKKSRKFRLGLFKVLLKTFKVNQCYLSIDTGDVQLNGLLYPGFYWLNKYTGKSIGINFLGKNEIILQIENNLARLIKAFILSTLKTKRSWKT
ncbi:MAG: hypothetical protein JO080_12090 [Mucilaginibacter sp.]|nr:hypothetical protein [Mucilaginibacter sp.]